MKRKMFFRLAAVCMVAVSVLIACTKDYGSDIQALQDNVDKLSAQVTALQSSIDAGSVITSVESITGGTRVTLSNGKTFDVTNGKDGDKGDKGDNGSDGTNGTVWTIGDNGNWYCDGVDSGKPSRGETGSQGVKGDTGASAYEVAKANGFEGTEAEWLASLKGQNGTNGDYYYPCTDKTSENYGKWIKVNGETAAETVTDQEWLPLGTITAVWDPESESITFHNVEGADEGVVSISLAAELKSLAIIPELWDATLGMPTSTVYAFLPSAWEIANVLIGRDANNQFRTNVLWPNTGINSWKQPEGFGLYYWCILWSTYLGKHGKNSPAYDETFDMSSSRFTYQWVINAMMEDFPDNEAYEFTYETFVNHIDEELALWKSALAAACDYGVNYTRQFPVSALNLKYRVNPAGANLDSYQFSMIDRSLKVSTKADGDNRNYAVAKVDAERSGKDQINVSGYINYFKYWSEQPVEWLLGLLFTKEIYSWDYYCKYDATTADASRAPQYKETFTQYVGRLINNNGYTGTILSTALTTYNNWMEAMGLDYETIVALEAAKDDNGAEAVVSDYASVQMEYVTPIWTAYNHNDANRSRERWMVAPNYFNSYKKTSYGYYENDYIEMGKTYDVASHMRFADPYYGTIDKLGFNVKYDYYVFSAANSQDYSRYDATGYADRDDNPSGETEFNFGAWDKVDVDANGIVSFKEGATGAIGKYVMITADASIYNEATGTWYNSAVGAADPWNDKTMHDTFAGHYILLVIPNADETVNVEHNLGDFDYLTLSKTANAPASKALEALDMDLDGFGNIYKTPVLTSTQPNGYTGTYQASNADMFNVTLDNQSPLGESSVTYTFEPKDEYKTEYPTLCYTIKYNITINWRETEPVLNPDYILYEEDGTLTKTIIDPDPVTVEPYSAENYPYVDTLIAVKGKAVDGTWTPQSSIREHILDYGTYMATESNISNLHMSINYTASKQDASTAEIFSTATSTGVTPYTTQEIKMLTPYQQHELYRDYVVDMNVTLANGVSKVVKGYIVRFICPMYIFISEDITLETHRTDWCSRAVYFEVRETGSDTKLAYFTDDRSGKVLSITGYASTSYAGVFAGMEAPVWKLNTDASFGGNLLCENNTGWFFWNNNGTDLQVDKEATYDVTLNLPELAMLSATGNIHVIRTADSHSAHNMEEGSPVEKVPGEGALPTYDIVFE